jgi:hypothetical protein
MKKTWAEGPVLRRLAACSKPLLGVEKLGCEVILSVAKDLLFIKIND